MYSFLLVIYWRWLSKTRVDRLMLEVCMAWLWLNCWNCIRTGTWEVHGPPHCRARGWKALSLASLLRDAVSFCFYAILGKWPGHLFMILPRLSCCYADVVVILVGYSQNWHFMPIKIESMVSLQTSFTGCKFNHKEQKKLTKSIALVRPETNWLNKWTALALRARHHSSMAAWARYLSSLSLGVWSAKHRCISASVAGVSKWHTSARLMGGTQQMLILFP